MSNNNNRQLILTIDFGIWLMHETQITRNRMKGPAVYTKHTSIHLRTRTHFGGKQIAPNNQRMDVLKALIRFMQIISAFH